MVKEVEMFKDNMEEIDEKFYKDYDHGKTSYAEGWAYRCKICGAYAYFAGAVFPCQGEAIIPVKIRCSNFPSCRNRWTLKLTPPPDMKKEG
jgi:hypothetical protein